MYRVELVDYTTAYRKTLARMNPKTLPPRPPKINPVRKKIMKYTDSFAAGRLSDGLLRLGSVDGDGELIIF